MTAGRLLVAVAVLGLVAAGVPAAAVAPGGTTTQERPTWAPGSTAPLPADSTQIEIAVRSDGSAVWFVRHEVGLDDPETRGDFEEVARSVEADPLNYTGPFAERMGEAATLAADRTGREMAVGNVSVHARQRSTREGVVTYRCVWTGFADASGDRIEIGDALVGFDLSSERLTLVVQWPASYDLETVTPEPDRTSERAAVWHGPVAFAPAEPSVVVTGGGPLPVAPAVAAAAAVAAVAVVGVGWRLRGRGTGSHSAGDGHAAGAAAGDDEVPEELLSDAERVLGLVEDNGGRMKQQDVVAALDWSETKTSQVVNDLEDEGELEIYNIGRENVLSLPGEMDV